jgi:hypothetical protein
MRRFALSILSLILALSLVAATPKRQPPARIAPNTLPHGFCQLLRSMSRDGNRQVTFKATAVGTRFFFEETGGVTVYRFENGQYVKEEFLRGTTLAKAVKKYAKRT